MSKIKASDMVSFVVEAYKAGWGYVYSAQGELYTRELAEKWGNANRSNKGYDYFVRQCARWFGRIVVDCSGLVIEAYRSQIPRYGDKTANTLYRLSVLKGAIGSIPEVPGLCVWRSGHIGIYVGNGKVIEAAGTNSGVVESRLSASASNRKWTNWGRLADVDYDNVVTPELPEPPTLWLGRLLKLATPQMRGVDVEQVQNALAVRGISPGRIDGFYGPKTQSAVKSFQRQAGLKVDGIVGEQTTKALKGIWMTDSQGNPSSPGKENQLDSFELGRLLRIASPYMRGIDVRDVQDALTLNTFSPGKVDGIFGPKTRDAVIGFQKSKRLKADGIVGPQTTNALGGIWTGR